MPPPQGVTFGLCLFSLSSFCSVDPPICPHLPGESEALWIKLTVERMWRIVSWPLSLWVSPAVRLCRLLCCYQSISYIWLYSAVYFLCQCDFISFTVSRLIAFKTVSLFVAKTEAMSLSNLTWSCCTATFLTFVKLVNIISIKQHDYWKVGRSNYLNFFALWVG